MGVDAVPVVEEEVRVALGLDADGVPDVEEEELGVALKLDADGVTTIVEQEDGIVPPPRTALAGVPPQFVPSTGVPAPRTLKSED